MLRNMSFYDFWNDEFNKKCKRSKVIDETIISNLKMMTNMLEKRDKIRIRIKTKETLELSHESLTILQYMHDTLSDDLDKLTEMEKDEDIREKINKKIIFMIKLKVDVLWLLDFRKYNIIEYMKQIGNLYVMDEEQIVDLIGEIIDSIISSIGETNFIKNQINDCFKYLRQVYAEKIARRNLLKK